VADILVVEDESVIRSALKRLLERNKFRVFEAASVKEAEENFQLDRFCLIISDLRLPGAPGTELIRRAGEVPVLIMTSYASLRSAVDAMRLGAVDYIAKPFDHDDLLTAIKRILRERSAQRLARGRDAARTASDAIDGMIGSCPLILEVYERIRRVAPTSTSVLIHGETGTGKELVARAIHRASKRSAQPLISVNCAAIPGALIESELFGFDKGGAAGGRSGIIEAASGGTLFLDEIGELPLEVQARLLRFIQSGELHGGGGTGPRTVDVRLISATQRNLKALCEEGKFRQDLYYRINVVELTLPPLRARGTDVLKIAEFLLDDACRRHDKTAKRFSAEAIEAITAYRWPGNVRELENAIERAVILGDEQEIPGEALAIDFGLPGLAELDAGDAHHEEREPAPGAEDPAEDLSLEEYFQRFVLQNQDHMSETELARKLGVSRKCLWERRQRFGIPRKKSTAEEDDEGRRSA
jgi:two-component system response regulator HydG